MREGRQGESLASEQRSAGELDARVDALRALTAAGVPFVVAGAYAFFEYTGIFRDTKDLDVFLRRRDLALALATLDAAGFRTEVIDPVWIAKAFRGSWFVDLIFGSGNGVASVDDTWFERAREAEVMGVPVLLAPPEEVIWSKAYVCERDRYDGNDVTNLMLAMGERLDWERLLERFGDDWAVLLAQIVLFRFSFPSERSRVPDPVMHELLRRALEEVKVGNADRRVCRGPLLSRHQYRYALDHLGYEDVRGVGPAQRAAVRDAGFTEGDHGATVSPGGSG